MPADHLFVIPIRIDPEEIANYDAREGGLRQKKPNLSQQQKVEHEVKIKNKICK